LVLIASMVLDDDMGLSKLVHKLDSIWIGGIWSRNRNGP
jgi:hypothetical protein